MMDVRINGDNMTVIAVGHAGAPRNADGRDMVCCAASTLIQTLVFSCQEIPGVVVDHSIAPGDVYIRVSPPPSRKEDVRHRLRMLSDGLKHLSIQYPELVRLRLDN